MEEWQSEGFEDNKLKRKTPEQITQILKAADERSCQSFQHDYRIIKTQSIYEITKKKLPKMFKTIFMMGLSGICLQ